MRNFSVRHPFFSLRRLRPADVLVFCLKDTAVHTALYIGGKYQEFIQCLEDPGYVSVEGFHGDKKGLRARRILGVWRPREWELVEHGKEVWKEPRHVHF
jgi:hypothetical protein